jgi:hypothetical protein
MITARSPNGLPVPTQLSPSPSTLRISVSGLAFGRAIVSTTSDTVEAGSSRRTSSLK